jgi:ABC-type transport system involved in cytochrome c biogenesis permease subunit
MIAKQEKLFTIGLYTALLGFIPHVAAIAMRWTATGITPFIDISESLTLGSFMAVLIFLIFQFSSKRVRPLGVLVIPVVFVLMGWAGTVMKEVAATLAPALQSGWIWVHIVGASAGFASVLIAAGLGLFYLLANIIGRTLGQLIEKVVEIIESIDLIAVCSREQRHENGDQDREEGDQQKRPLSF